MKFTTAFFVAMSVTTLEAASSHHDSILLDAIPLAERSQKAWADSDWSPVRKLKQEWPSSSSRPTLA
ncbi:MAG TPA: hypothetical protein VGJ29_13000 [Vicinamibacterales bacterium]